MSVATKALALDETLQDVVSELQRLTSVAVTGDIDDLGDVNAPSPANGDILRYNSSTSKWENTSLPSGLHIYSTTEQRVGTWIDNKPVYERIFALGSRLIVSADSWGTTDIPTADILGIIDSAALDINSQGSITRSVLLLTDRADSYIKVWNGRNQPLGFTHLLLRYIKSTD